MSPAPLRNPAAFVKVGAEITVVAAKALNTARRVMLKELLVVIGLAPVPSLTIKSAFRGPAISSPDAVVLLHTQNRRPSIDFTDALPIRHLGEKLRKYCKTRQKMVNIRCQLVSVECWFKC